MNYEERLAELDVMEKWLTQKGVENWKQLFDQRRQDLNTAIGLTKARYRQRTEQQAAEYEQWKQSLHSDDDGRLNVDPELDNIRVACPKCGHEGPHAVGLTDCSDIMVNCGKCEFGFMASPDGTFPYKPHQYYVI